MIPTARRPGKNEQPPCFRCNQSAPNETNLLQPLVESEPAPFVMPFSARDNCVGLGNPKLKSLAGFFTDPASYPNSTQSPIGSPTNFGVLFQSPPQIPQGGFLFASEMINQIDVSDPALRITATGVATSQNMFNIIFDDVPSLPDDVNDLYVSLPPSVSSMQAVSFGTMSIVDPSVPFSCFQNLKRSEPALVVGNGSVVYALFPLVDRSSCTQYTINIGLDV